MTEDDYRRLPDDRLLDCWWHAQAEVGRNRVYVAPTQDRKLWDQKLTTVIRILKERGILL